MLWPLGKMLVCTVIVMLGVSALARAAEKTCREANAPGCAMVQGTAVRADDKIKVGEEWGRTAAQALRGVEPGGAGQFDPRQPALAAIAVPNFITYRGPTRQLPADADADPLGSSEDLLFE